jgi:hypothetical protein
VCYGVSHSNHSPQLLDDTTKSVLKLLGNQVYSELLSKLKQQVNATPGEVDEFEAICMRNTQDALQRAKQESDSAIDEL